MVLIGLGANLPHPEYGDARSTLEAALAVLEERGIRVAARSRWFRSAPVPPSDQPWFINGVAALETDLGPVDLLAQLHDIENAFGRVRREPNAPRRVDLDLLDYDGRVREGGEGDSRRAGPTLPHPRMAERAFVLLPLADVAPGWRHPVTGRPLEKLIEDLPGDQIAEPVGEREA
ncbi:MAG: 2-amino-4-hydroxy-6-hydroxymethyldihydropteridine diphosphokinase [Rhodovibrionaceae bacterium]|nr:2-amino-4-hydroxy-6-hydroxymethyldihydropteridine diphosphokinase [Rhodovibrionaceae bacterium]